MNKWKKIDNDNSQAITFSNGRRFKVCKNLDINCEHSGEWQVHEWDRHAQEWEWVDTYTHMWFAKQNAETIARA